MTRRLALIGPSEHAVRRLLPALRQVPGARLVLVSSRDLAKAEAVAASMPGARATSDWAEVFDPSAIDGVIVTGPPTLHADVVRRCIDSGQAVYAEKPVASDSAEVEALISRAQAKGAERVFVGYNFAFAEPLARLTGHLAQGAPIRVAKVRFVSNKPTVPLWGRASLLESTLLATGVHAIAMLALLFGEPDAVHADKVDLRQDRFALHARLRFPDGLLAMMELGNFHHRFDTRYEFVCDDGRAGWIENHGRIGLVPPPGAATPAWPPAAPTLIEPGVAYATDDHAGYVAALRRFVEGMEAGVPMASPLALSRTVHRVVERILAAV